jgi:hypothetical protein
MVKENDYTKFGYTKEQIEGVCPVGAITVEE